VQCSIWLFAAIAQFRAFPVCCSGVVWVIMRWFQSPLLLLVLRLVLHSTCAVFLFTGITFGFTFCMRCVSIVNSLCITRFGLFFITFLSRGTELYANTHVPSSVSRIVIAGLMLAKVLSVCTCWFHNMVILPSRRVPTYFGKWSYQSSLSNCTPVSLHILKCTWAHMMA
jgi:hypothetical protein